MWLYRKVLEIPWADRITNIEVLRRTGKEKEVVNTVKLVTHNKKLQLIIKLTGKVRCWYRNFIANKSQNLIPNEFHSSSSKQP